MKMALYLMAAQIHNNQVLLGLDKRQSLSRLPVTLLDTQPMRSKLALQTLTLPSAGIRQVHLRA